MPKTKGTRLTDGAGILRLGRAALQESVIGRSARVVQIPNHLRQALPLYKLLFFQLREDAVAVLDMLHLNGEEGV
jgi:hypothetical protein